MSNLLQKRIMRRVYYAFALRMTTHPYVVHGVLFSVALVAFTKAVSVPSILTNMSSVQLGDLGSYILNAFMRAEVITLLLIGVMVFTLLSLRMNVKVTKLRDVQMV